MKAFVSSLFIGVGLVMASLAQSQTEPGSMNVHWDEGAQQCKAIPAPIQVHAYNSHTYILRENLCATFEAPFLYLLIGTTRALLIDTGDVADPNAMPLAATVMNLLPTVGSTKLTLLVVHTHRHLDHRAGDKQFGQLPNVEKVGFDLDSVRRYYHFVDWPNGLAQIDLGNRIVDVIPTPGHNETELAFYDRKTGLFFSGDFLMPGRLLIGDTSADHASARRVASFVKSLEVSYVLGGHIELDEMGKTYPWGSQFHPREHVLQLSKDDLLALPAAIASYNGLYSSNGKFLMINSTWVAVGLVVLLVIFSSVFVLLIVVCIRYRRRRTEQRKAILARFPVEQLCSGARETPEI